MVKIARGSVVYPRVEQLLKKLGEDISIARRVRRIGVEDFAKRIQVSRATLRRLESGDPSVSLNTLAMALHALGRLDALADIADARHDHVTLHQMMEDVPKRIAKRKTSAKDVADVEEKPTGKYIGF